MRRRTRKTLQRRLALTPPPRITLPKAVTAMAVTSLADLIAQVMREQPERRPRDGGSHE